MKRLGTVSEARDALGLTDSAEVWELVAGGHLEATDDPESGKWIIWDTR